MSHTHPSSRSSSTNQSIDYTPQQFLTYLQSIKKFENFDQSTLILQSQSANKASSLNIRITDHQHIGLHPFITDCIIICKLDSDCNITDNTATSIISIQHILSLSKSFLVSFYNAFFHFLSILTQIFDDKIVSTKLRIRGPYLLMINKEAMQILSSFLLSQIIMIENNIEYEMHLKEMKNLRYCIHLIKSLLQFELFTFDFVGFDVISNIVLFSQHENVKDWSKSLIKLFDVALMIKLPTNSVGILSKFTVDKLILLEKKAILTTKAFISFIITLIRFLIIHYHDKMIGFNHIDIMMKALFEDHHDILTHLWSKSKLETEFNTEYQTKQKYESSAFLKGKKERKRNEIKFDEINNIKYDEFIKEECFLLILDIILPFCMDFKSFYDTINNNKYGIYDDIMNTLNDILLYFIKKEKWWYFSHIISIYNHLFEDERIFKHYLALLQNDNDLAVNIKYGIYSFMIWICYIHQIAPKPVICFFDEGFDPNKAKREKLLNKDDGIEVFNTLNSVEMRITELSISKSVLIQLLITIGHEWLIDDIISNLMHIRDKYVLVKLLMILLHSIDHLIINNVLDYHQDYMQRFIKVFHHFKHKILSNNNNNYVEPRPNPTKNVMKSKIVFRKQKVKTTSKSSSKHKENNSKNTEKYQDIKRDNDNTVIFEHFTKQSMKIVDCIVNDNKHLLYQFVTKSPSKPSPKRPRSKKEEIPNDLSVDMTLLSTTLSSIETALNTPQNDENIDNTFKNDENTDNTFENDENIDNTFENDDQDFDFNFESISNIDRTYYMEPPKKKQKTTMGQREDHQITDLLNYLCDSNDNDKKESISPRYPRPKAPTMNEDSNWTNLVNMNRY